MLTGTGAANAGEVNEMSKDTKVALASNLTSLKVIPASHSDTATGWGISGVTDKFGRPIVLSQPAAGAFLRMMVDSKGQVNASDVASSGRSIKKNASVGGHENSVHLYGEGLDLSGASHKWMLKNGIKYGWKYKYSHGPGSGHYDYVGVGSGSTPILSPFGGKSFSVAKPGRDPGGVSPSVTTSGSSDFLKVLDGINFSKGMEMFGRFAPMERNQGLMDAFGSMMGGEGATLSKPFFTRRSSNNYEEQARIRRVTEQRNQARREINNKTNEIVQMALAAVESSNGSNRQFISIAEQGIRQLLGAQAVEEHLQMFKEQQELFLELRLQFLIPLIIHYEVYSHEYYWPLPSSVNNNNKVGSIERAVSGEIDVKLFMFKNGRKLQTSEGNDDHHLS